MEKGENKYLEYVSKVFKELPKEKKDYLLHTARQLLKIQHDGAFLLFAKKTAPQNEQE